MPTAHEMIEQWRQATVDEVFVSASRVQDRLFDLYGEVRELPAGRTVEAWLTLTIQRDLFSSAELLGLLDEIEGGLNEPVGTSF